MMKWWNPPDGVLSWCKRFAELQSWQMESRLQGFVVCCLRVRTHVVYSRIDEGQFHGHAQGKRGREEAAVWEADI